MPIALHRNLVSDTHSRFDWQSRGVQRAETDPLDQRGPFAMLETRHTDDAGLFCPHCEVCTINQALCD